MSPAFLITLREGLEISLVLAILLGYLVKTERRDLTSSVWLGAGIAAIACLVAGVVVHSITDGLEGKAEQAVEGTLALGATVVLTWMILWMRKNARTMGGHLRTKVDSAASPGALAVISFVAVAREGFETVLFLLGAETESASASQVVLGGLLGLVVAAVVGVLVYRFGTRIDLGSFFRTTGVLLILFAAGLAGKAVHEFRELFGVEHRLADRTDVEHRRRNPGEGHHLRLPPWLCSGGRETRNGSGCSPTSPTWCRFCGASCDQSPPLNHPQAFVKRCR